MSRFFKAFAQNKPDQNLKLSQTNYSIPNQSSEHILKKKLTIRCHAITF